MDYSKLTPLLVQAVNALRAEKNAQISEQQVMIASQKKQIERLEAQAEAFKKLLCSTNRDADICKEKSLKGTNVIASGASRR